MSIDPKAITAADIDQYENLMQGSMASGSSNANHQTGQLYSSSQTIKASHTWRNDFTSLDGDFGPLEYRFQRPISLVSLTFNITLLCEDSTDLLQVLNPGIKIADKKQTQNEKDKED